MLEIDVDVRRLQPLLGDEALEQEIDPGRIDRGDAEHVADRRVRRRSPPLAQDVLAARIMHDVVHGEEVVRVFQLGDQRELFLQGRAQLVIDVAAEICLHARPGQILQMPLRGLARRHRFVRILVFELVEREIDLARKAHGLRDRLGKIAEQPRHFAWRLQEALGIGFELPSDRLDRGLFPDAGQHVLERTAARDGDRAPRWSRAAARLLWRRDHRAAPGGGGRRRDRPGSPPATRPRRGCP